MLIALLIACGTAPEADSDPEVVDTDVADTEPPDTDVPVVTHEDIGGQDPHVADWIFDPMVIHQVTISIPPDSVDLLYAEPFDYAPVSASFDGEQFAEVGVRLRGKYGSFRELSGKPKFRLDFNRYVPDGNLYGLESLTLNNEVVDCGYLREPLGYRIFRDAGVPAARTSWAQVTVNGEYYGLYVIIETPDEQFLEARYEDPTGNLYDGKYVLYEDWSYDLLDFNSGVDDLYGLEEGVDVDHAEIHAISRAMRNNDDPDQFDEELSRFINWDELHTHLAVEELVGHVDGYAMNTNNNRVYFNPLDGLMDMHPYDLDYGFIPDRDWGMSWDSPRGQLASRCWRDSSCRAAHSAAVAEVLDNLDVQAMHDYLDELDGLTFDLARDDPKRECGTQQIRQYRTSLHDWLDSQPTVMQTRWNP